MSLPPGARLGPYESLGRWLSARECEYTGSWC